jgi:hypothetical protein
VRVNAISFLIAVSASLCAPWACAASLDLTVQHRDGGGNGFTSSLSIDPAKTAIVVIDMWNSCPDPESAARVHSLVPRMNETLDVARQLGMQVIFAPAYMLTAPDIATNPRRAATAALPNVTKPGTGTSLSSNPPYGRLGGTMGIPPGISVPAMPNPTDQDPNLVIRNDANDWIIDCDNDQELWNVMAHTGATNLLYTGMYTNRCVWARDCGIKKVASELNVQPVLLSDLTDAYSGNGKNSITGAADSTATFDRGTNTVVNWYQMNAFGTIGASQLLAHASANKYCYSARIANDSNLVCYWRLDGYNGDKVVQDVKTTQAAWNTQNVTLGVSGAIRGDSDTAAKFNGTAAAVVAPTYQANLPTDSAGFNSLRTLNSGSFSVEGWVQVDQLSGSAAWVLSHCAGTASDSALDFSIGLNANHQFCFNTRGTKGAASNTVADSAAVTQSDVDSNHWFYVVGVQDLASNTLKLYLDGHLAATQDGLNGTAVTVGAGLVMGGLGLPTVNSSGSVTDGMTEYLNGELDEIAVYHRALSVDDIWGHYMLGMASSFPDTNGDDKVDMADLARILMNYDKSGMAWAQGDFDGNGVVDIVDLDRLLTNFNKTSGASAGIKAVPEPATLVLLGISAIGMLGYAWRRKQGT